MTIRTTTPAESTYISDTYDLLYREGQYVTQFAILGRDEAATVIREAASGKVIAHGNRGDRHYS